MFNCGLKVAGQKGWLAEPSSQPSLCGWAFGPARLNKKADWAFGLVCLMGLQDAYVACSAATAAATFLLPCQPASSPARPLKLIQTPQTKPDPSNSSRPLKHIQTPQTNPDPSSSDRHLKPTQTNQTHPDLSNSSRTLNSSRLLKPSQTPVDLTLVSALL